MNQLHPGARWLFRVRGYFGALLFLIFIGWFIFPIIGVISMFVFQTGPQMIIATVLVGIFIYLILIIVIAEIYARMTYNRWFYEFTDSGLRLERGIIWKRYSNVPYERIQNVDIHRGIIARMAGFSSVAIQTAGYSAYASAEGSIPAVDTEGAEKIREFLMKKITKK
jgi:putative membrane protein